MFQEITQRVFRDLPGQKPLIRPVKTFMEVADEMSDSSVSSSIPSFRNPSFSDVRSMQPAMKKSFYQIDMNPGFY